VKTRHPHTSLFVLAILLTGGLATSSLFLTGHPVQAGERNAPDAVEK
jgi:hypothetical protein